MINQSVWYKNRIDLRNSKNDWILVYDYNSEPNIESEFVFPTHFWSIPGYINHNNVVVGSWDSKIRCFNLHKKEIEWVYKTKGPVYSSPAVLSDGSFIIGCEDGYLRRISALGSTIWEFQADGKFHATPTVDEKECLVFATCYDHFIYTIGLNNGQLLWKKEFNPHIDEDIYSSPAITEDKQIIFGTGPDVVCLDYNGNMIWTFSTKDSVDSTPSIDNQRRIGVVGSFDNKIYAFNINTGKIIWSYKTNGLIGTSPAQFKNIVAIGSDDGFIYGLDIINGDLKWKNNNNAKMLFTPITVLPNGNFCYVTLDERLWCINYLTGKPLWIKQFPKFGVHSAPSVSPIGYITIGSDKGAFYILKFKK